MGDPADDALLMAKAGAVVAAVVVPLAVVCAALLRRSGERVCPRWALPPFVWTGPFILGFFLWCQIGLPLNIAAFEHLGFFRIVYPHGFPPIPEGVAEGDASRLTTHLKVMWVSMYFVPLVLAIAVAVRTITLGAAFPRITLQFLLRCVLLGTAVWLTFGTAAYLLNLLIQLAFNWLNIPIDKHPLSKLGPTGDGHGGRLFVLSACVAAPVLEEFLFRGLLIDWAGGRWYRPWVLVLAAAGWVVLMGGERVPLAPLGFVAVLGVGLYLTQQVIPKVRRRFPKRTSMTIWSSSVLFAAAHSSVWPTPIPLFVLALGLGYVTSRTRSWLPAAVAHGLFNLVSTVFVFLRG